MYGKEKLYTISYANDIVILAENEERLKEMLPRFDKYLERRCLKMKKVIGRVKKMKYLEYEIKENNKKMII